MRRGATAPPGLHDAVQVTRCKVGIGLDFGHRYAPRGALPGAPMLAELRIRCFNRWLQPAEPSRAALSPRQLQNLLSVDRRRGPAFRFHNVTDCGNRNCSLVHRLRSGWSYLVASLGNLTSLRVIARCSSDKRRCGQQSVYQH
jgi:hypothetical protein